MVRPVRGMKDFYGESAYKYNYLIKKITEVGEIHGYSPIFTPIVEYSDIFLRSLGDESDVVSKEMYTFDDRGGDSITLRPEGTAGVLRALVSENIAQTLPVKVMYHGPMFRYDRPQKGRYRQFHQIGFEYVGDDSPYTDAGVILLASDILKALRIYNCKVYVNTLGDEESRANYTKAIVKYFSRHVEELSDDSKRRLEKNPLRILDSKDMKDRELISMAPLIKDYMSKDAGRNFEKVCQLLESFDVDYEIDDLLVRGLDYYSHTAFELKSTSGIFNDAIGGGGRYDKLLSEFGGADASGMGFALGAERLMLLMNNVEPPANTIGLIAVSDIENDEVFKLTRDLQTHGIPAHFLQGQNMSKKLKIADRNGVDVVVILGSQELENETVTVKFLRKQEDEKNVEIGKSNLISFLKNM